MAPAIPRPAAAICKKASLDAGGANVNNRPVNSTTVAMIFDTRAAVSESKVFPSESGAKVGSPHSYTKRLSGRHLRNVNIVFFDGHVASFLATSLMDGSGQNIKTSPVIWNPWNPDDQ